MAHNSSMMTNHELSPAFSSSASAASSANSAAFSSSAGTASPAEGGQLRAENSKGSDFYALGGLKIDITLLFATDSSKTRQQISTDFGQFLRFSASKRPNLGVFAAILRLTLSTESPPRDRPKTRHRKLAPGSSPPLPADSCPMPAWP